MEKLLDSDWLRAVQFKCNTDAKSVTPVQITHRNSTVDYDWLKDERKFLKQWYHVKWWWKVCAEGSKDKKGLQERSSGTSSVGNCIQRVDGSDSKFTTYF